MDTLEDYFRETTAKVGLKLSDGELFAKILTPNDDSGRHGVLIPSDVYSFFPVLEIEDPATNVTGTFACYDVLDRKQEAVGYKYYQRYPERRITRLNPLINDSASRRLVIFLRGKTATGAYVYLFDARLDDGGEPFRRLVATLFGPAITAIPGRFIRREISAHEFRPDSALSELLERFDAIELKKWTPSLRLGATGIGYTFETLMGVAENNDKTADFRGIEIKCKLKREGASGAKINLFQQAPTWRQKLSAAQRIRLIGKAADEGLYSCYSQVTTRANNLGLRLDIHGPAARMDLVKVSDAIGDWDFSTLARRLEEKHSRAVFVSADARSASDGTKYWYKELVYCERPSIARFVDLVANRNVVFEFTMSEKPDGSIRNHGYPWRLAHDGLLEQLFSMQVRLR